MINKKNSISPLCNAFCPVQQKQNTFLGTDSKETETAIHQRGHTGTHIGKTRCTETQKQIQGQICKATFSQGQIQTRTTEEGWKSWGSGCRELKAVFSLWLNDPIGEVLLFLNATPMHDWLFIVNH